MKRPTKFFFYFKVKKQMECLHTNFCFSWEHVRNQGELDLAASYFSIRKLIFIHIGKCGLVNVRILISWMACQLDLGISYQITYFAKYSVHFGCMLAIVLFSSIVTLWSYLSHPEESTSVLKKAESEYKGHRSLLTRTRNLLTTMKRQDVMDR